MDDAARIGDLKPVDFFNAMGMEKEIEIDRKAGGVAFSGSV